MKKNPFSIVSGGLLVALVFLVPVVCRATLPEPDNILFGSIFVGGNPLGQSDTGYVVEIRRTPTGTPVASYQMGSNPAANGLFSVRLSVESIAPLANTGAVLIGDSLYVAVRNGASDLAVTNYTVSDRGLIGRMDFAIGGVKTLSAVQTWQYQHMGSVGQSLNSSPTGKPQTLISDYIAGSDPNNSNDVFAVNISIRNAMPCVSFPALEASGAAYAGLTRYYALDWKADLLDPWQPVFNYDNILATNQIVVYQVPTNGNIGFYRGRVWLNRQ